MTPIKIVNVAEGLFTNELQNRISSNIKKVFPQYDIHRMPKGIYVNKDSHRRKDGSLDNQPLNEQELDYLKKFALQLAYTEISVIFSNIKTKDD